jgi:hypothetical protein
MSIAISKAITKKQLKNNKKNNYNTIGIPPLEAMHHFFKWLFYLILLTLAQIEAVILFIKNGRFFI